MLSLSAECMFPLYFTLGIYSLLKVLETEISFEVYSFPGFPVAEAVPQQFALKARADRRRTVEEVLRLAEAEHARQEAAASVQERVKWAPWWDSLPRLLPSPAPSSDDAFGSDQIEEVHLGN